MALRRGRRRTHLPKVDLHRAAALRRCPQVLVGRLDVPLVLFLGTVATGAAAAPAFFLLVELRLLRGHLVADLVGLHLGEQFALDEQVSEMRFLRVGPQLEGKVQQVEQQRQEEQQQQPRPVVLARRHVCRVGGRGRLVGGRGLGDGRCRPRRFLRHRLDVARRRHGGVRVARNRHSLGLEARSNVAGQVDELELEVAELGRVDEVGALRLELGRSLAREIADAGLDALRAAVAVAVAIHVFAGPIVRVGRASHAGRDDADVGARFELPREVFRRAAIRFRESLARDEGKFGAHFAAGGHISRAIAVARVYGDLIRAVRDEHAHSVGIARGAALLSVPDLRRTVGERVGESGAAFEGAAGAFPLAQPRFDRGEIRGEAGNR